MSYFNTPEDAAFVFAPFTSFTKVPVYGYASEYAPLHQAQIINHARGQSVGISGLSGCSYALNMWQHNTSNTWNRSVSRKRHH